MHPDLSPTPLMDADDLHMLLDWLVEHFESEPDSANPFAMMEREGIRQHRSFIHGIDYEEANDRLHHFIMRSVMHCFSVADAQADPQTLPQLLPKLVLLLWYTEHFYISTEDKAHLVNTLKRLLARAPIPFQAAQWLSELESSTYRVLIAGAMTSGQPYERKLLKTLLKDTSSKVRGRAAEVLAASGEVGWWEGSFASDPSPCLTDEAQEDAARAWMDASRAASRYTSLSEDTIEATLGQLPPIAQREALAMFLRDPELARCNAARLGPILCATPDAHAVLHALPPHWAKKHTYQIEGLLESLTASASAQTRRALWELIYQELPSAPIDHDSDYSYKCRFLTSAWPSDVPYTALFERIQSKPHASHDFTAQTLWVGFVQAVITRPDAQHWPDLEARLCADALTGTHTRWTPSPFADVNKLVAGAPPDVRARVETIWLSSGSTPHIAAALEARFTSPDTHADEAEALLWTCWEDALLRAGLLSSHKLVQQHITWLRARLDSPSVEASLSLQEVYHILMQADRCRGPAPSDRARFQDQLIQDIFKIENREKYDRVLPHPHPLTSPERALARTVRARTPRVCRADWEAALRILPAEPALWDDSDHSIFDEAWTRYSEGCAWVDSMTLAAALFALRPPDVLARFVSLLQRNQTAASIIHECLLGCIVVTARALGVPVPELPPLTALDD